MLRSVFWQMLELGASCEGPSPGQRGGLCFSFSPSCKVATIYFLKAVEHGIKELNLDKCRRLEEERCAAEVLCYRNPVGRQA